MTLISIIIATKNEEKNIKMCLDSCKKQTYTDIELIVVDYNSEDKTKEMAQKFGAKVLALDNEIDVSNIINYRGAQLNLGVDRSMGDIIFFPDADMTFSGDLLMDASNLLTYYDALYVPEVIIGKGFLGKVRNFERSFYDKTCVDAVRFVKREAFSEVGGFDATRITFGPDDWDFTKMLKQKNKSLGITRSVLYHHEENLDIKMYLRKKQGYINSFEGYVRKWGKNDPDVRKQLGFFYRLIGIFIENKKFIRLIKHPSLSLGMFYLRIRVGWNYLFAKIL